MTTIELLERTKAAWGSIRSASAEEKDRLLLAMAESLEANSEDILRENAKDMEAAKGAISDVMLDRLALTESRIHAMAEGIREAAALPDHVGRALAQFKRPNGMTITKRQVPLGLVAIIYESRPNVTSDAAALCIKSGNVCMLRSGKEAYRSSHAIVTALKAGVESVGGDSDIVNIVEDTTHASAQVLMTADGLVDLLIPRGGKGLIRACVENASVPCIETGTGICHVYVDRDADLNMAVKIIENAKTSRPSVCNAEEVCLVHRGIAKEFLPKLKAALVDKRREAGLVPFSMPQNILQGVVALYRALYRKWRPRKFADVVGQEAIVTALQNQIAAGRIGHAYLFTGTRGTGKTTCAKIFAKAVNCLDTTSPDPCGECAVCKGIDEGTILDVSEIDAASNNSVDDIRDLRDETAYLPAVCKYKVYIIDEVHMLSTSAFNALLKTMEEPPEHVIFILATTEVQKVPATILSRCQRYDFQRITADKIAGRLEYVAGQVFL